MQILSKAIERLHDKKLKVKELEIAIYNILLYFLSTL